MRCLFARFLRDIRRHLPEKRASNSSLPNFAKYLHSQIVAEFANRVRAQSFIASVYGIRYSNYYYLHVKARTAGVWLKNKIKIVMPQKYF